MTHNGAQWHGCLANRARHLGRAVRWVGAIGTAAVLAGCASNDGPPPACPEVGTLNAASQMSVFQDSGRDLTDKRFEVRVADTALACEVDQDEEGQTVAAEMQILFDAEKGPANTTGSAPFTYFVAILDTQGNVVQRSHFDASVPLPGNTTRNQIVETLAPTLPLKTGVKPNRFRILVGLELTRDQLQYNRDNAS